MRVRSLWRGLLPIVALCIGVAPLRFGFAQTQPGLPAARLVLGYYVPYDPTSWASLQAHANQLNLVAAQWATIDACGGLTTHDDQTLKAFAREHGLAVEPSMPTTSAWLNHRLLTDDATRIAAIQNIIQYTLDEGYPGFDLDLEGVSATDRDALTEFVSELSSALHDQGKFLTMAVPAKERDATSGWAGAFDYAALGADADLLTIMAYEYRGPFSGPGSVAPYDWVDRVTAFASEQIPENRLLLGLAFYGYDWNLTSGGALALGYPRAMTLAEHEQAEPGFDTSQQSLTFGYTADAADQVPPGPPTSKPQHTITTRTGDACDVVSPFPPSTPRPLPVPEAGVPQTHDVWIENSSSVAARIGLVDADHLRGIAAWRLGFEDPNVWPLLDQWRASAQGA
ncbi:MAG: hypothetical protein JO057_03710 [Chloroflexi bacterium]|nr:hypothetical protein [Chloroflexota bacterium]